MENVHVEVQRDYLERVAAATRPLRALVELIWNSLDADATEVRVEFKTTPLEMVDEIRIIDNGNGIPLGDAAVVFKKLGGSWKKGRSRTLRLNRALHGKGGVGRFSAFSIGNKAVWETRWLDAADGRLKQYAITGRREIIGDFSISDAVHAAGSAGTVVSISNIDKQQRALLSDPARQEITEEFALYLNEYASVALFYDGVRIDPKNAQRQTVTYSLAGVDAGDRDIGAELVIIEWRTAVDRFLYLCDASGFFLTKTSPNIRARGFDFTAYLKSDYFKEARVEHAFSADGFDDKTSRLLEQAREALRTHFRRRAAEDAIGIIDEWKKEKIYPYKGDPENIVEEAERQVFDICAMNINDLLPDFANGDFKTKKLALRLLREALEQEPSALKEILQDVFDLSKQKQQEFADLLKKATLPSIINAVRRVSDRAFFVGGLKSILFDYKSHLRERKELHRILADNVWLFGEEFNLSVDDEGLTAVLEAHRKLLDPTHKRRRGDKPVATVEGGKGIVDLMLSRKIRLPHADRYEHLVVELKAPAVKITTESMTQLMKYGGAVAADDRFRSLDTKWTFWAVSNEIDPLVKQMSMQPNRPLGIYNLDTQHNITYWAMEWSEIISHCEGRLKFFQEALNLVASKTGGLEHIASIYSNYLPQQVHDDLASSRSRKVVQMDMAALLSRAQEAGPIPPPVAAQPGTSCQTLDSERVVAPTPASGSPPNPTAE